MLKIYVVVQNILECIIGILLNRYALLSMNDTPANMKCSLNDYIITIQCSTAIVHASISAPALALMYVFMEEPITHDDKEEKCDKTKLVKYFIGVFVTCGCMFTEHLHTIWQHVR